MSTASESSAERATAEGPLEAVDTADLDGGGRMDEERLCCPGANPADCPDQPSLLASERPRRPGRICYSLHVCTVLAVLPRNGSFGVCLSAVDGSAHGSW